MKRLLLALVLAVILLGLLATPAVASPPSAPDFRLQANTAYVFAYIDGSWFEVTDVAAGTFVAHWATYDEVTGDLLAPADPIPANLDIVMQESWKGWTFGLIKQLPTAFEIQLSIPEADVDISYEEAKAYWTGPFLWDDYWVNALGTWPAFNPNVGAEIYANRWLLPLGKLDPGTYTVSYSERWVKTWTNMDQLNGDFGPPVNRPWHAKPGDGASTSFTFTVQ